MNVNNYLQSLHIFIERMKRLGIDMKLTINFPWIYIRSINGKEVTETFQSEHGFVIAYHPIRYGEQLKITNIKEVFNLIRKYRQ